MLLSFLIHETYLFILYTYTNTKTPGLSKQSILTIYSPTQIHRHEFHLTLTHIFTQYINDFLLLITLTAFPCLLLYYVAYLCFVVMIHIYIYIRTRRRLWVCWYQIKSFSPFDTTFISFIFVTLPFFFCLIIMCLEYMAIFCELSSYTCVVLNIYIWIWTGVICIFFSIPYHLISVCV